MAVFMGIFPLLDVDFEAMEKALKPNRKKIESKGIRSVRSRVGNIREHLAPQYQGITIEEFKDLMVCQLLQIETISQAKRYDLTEKDWQQIDALTERKYHNWEWNYGNAPQYRYHRDGRFTGGTVDIHLDIKKAILQLVAFTEIFLARQTLQNLKVT